jgi:sulfite reductase alpha subunit-like flavoprotein
MNWAGSADQPIMFIPYPGVQLAEHISPPIPYLRSYPHLTLRILLTDYLDIRAIPTRFFFSNIAHYTENAMHKEKLLEFSNPENIDELWDYTTRPRRSILEVLEEFESVKIPWQHAASIFPPMRGRQFSIASGGELKQTAEGGTKIELLVAIVKYQTVIKKIREGACTRYFSVLSAGSTVKIQLQKGGLNPSMKQLLGPTVLIGPGTGLAPLRAMIWEKAALVRAYREKHTGIDPPIGTTILLFGGRNLAADYFFEGEWRQFAESIDLKVITAFSRDQRQKIYVQDKIREKLSVFFQLLHDQSGSVFVCGSSGRMPQAVREALVSCFQQSPDIDHAMYTRGEAERYLFDMEKVGRYKQETW